MRGINSGELLDLFCWGMDKISRPTLLNLIGGYSGYERDDHERLLRRLAAEKLIVKTRRGREAEFQITEMGRRRVETLNPRAAWERVWDGGWRMVVYDLPMAKEKERFQLWRAFREHKLGLLQQSVWIWPHPLKPILKAIIQAKGIPECFCGFTARELFLCTDGEVAETAWDIDEIATRHEGYERHPMANLTVLNKAKTLSVLSAVARAERQAYEHAFFLDPLLPRVLWPKGYRGAEVEARHEAFRRRLGTRLSELTSD